MDAKDMTRKKKFGVISTFFNLGVTCIVEHHEYPAQIVELFLSMFHGQDNKVVFRS